MHACQFKKIDPYDWFCAPGSHLSTDDINYLHAFTIRLGLGFGLGLLV